MNDAIAKAMNWRYAAQKLDPNKKVSEADLNTILDAGRLAPSAFGVEPWHFILIENPELQKKLYDEASPQDKVKYAPHFLVVAKRTDARETLAKNRVARSAKAMGVAESDLQGLRDMIDGTIAGKDDVQLASWVRAQVYIPLGAMIEAAALLGVDAGPMEGFDHNKFDEILGLKEMNLSSEYAIAFGYRLNDDAAQRPKARQTMDEVLTRM